MEAIAIQRCVEIVREIRDGKKRITEFSFDMHLYPHQIAVKDEQITLSTVYDISYRTNRGADAIGFLYLHTNRGVRTFYVREHPASFIDAYQKLKDSRS
ncbi:MULTISPECIES: hypothetical protein [unclassified Paenibacillus]|uniref:hypothetical protein n=1 Tax=unclassified Paenibacillus TaxID=185978 RepID=UPI001C10868C|nr:MULTISPECIES: hypothetical protein [unclassified Paenibacillus]MBU5443610.1 hypothetical protein [Paenibacillus sp. MSJ-34]CAH0120004.1 hypothetical protein PAE9249_02513 [Paenibacillus sp. CECT 9249]